MQMKRLWAAISSKEKKLCISRSRRQTKMQTFGTASQPSSHPMEARPQWWPQQKCLSWFWTKQSLICTSNTQKSPFSKAKLFIAWSEEVRKFSTWKAMREKALRSSTQPLMSMLKTLVTRRLKATVTLKWKKPSSSSAMESKSFEWRASETVKVSWAGRSLKAVKATSTSARLTATNWAHSDGHSMHMQWAKTVS